MRKVQKLGLRFKLHGNLSGLKSLCHPTLGRSHPCEQYPATGYLPASHLVCQVSRQRTAVLVVKEPLCSSQTQFYVCYFTYCYDQIGDRRQHQVGGSYLGLRSTIQEKARRQDPEAAYLHVDRSKSEEEE